MPIDLKMLGVAPEPRAASVAVTDLVATPFRAPREYQTAAPPEMYPSRFAAIGSSEDLDRVLALKRRPPLDLHSERAEALIELITSRWSRGPRDCRCAEIDAQIKAGRRSCLKRFNALQAWILYELGIVGGVIASAAVGSGKTILDIQAPLALVLFDPNIRSVLLLVPPGLITQLAHEYDLLAEHFVVPEMWLHDGSNARTLQPGMPVLHVLPYSRLSLPKSSDWIRNLKPDAIVADECFPGSTLVRTDVGDVPIGLVVDHELGTEALSYDPISGFRWRRILHRIRRNLTKRLVRVTHDRGHFVCTADHKIWTEHHGYVKAAELDETHSLRLCPLRQDVQTAVTLQTVLLSDMRHSSARSRCQQGARAQTRRPRPDHFARVPGVRQSLLGSVLHERPEPLQHSLLETVPAQAAGVSRMWSDVLSEEVASNLLQSRVCARLYAVETASRSSAAQNSDSDVPGVRDRVQHMLQTENVLCHMSQNTHKQEDLRSARGAKVSGTLPSAAHEAFRIQCVTRSAEGSSGENARSHVSVAWRERETNRTSVAAVEASEFTGLGVGVSDSDEACSGALPEPAGFLQGGYRDTAGQISDRGRRTQPHDQEMEVSGQTEDRDSEFSRVVGVEILESGDHGGPDSCSKIDQVYDLTVEGEHNYFADGVLVSNCDRLRNPDGAGTSRVLRRFFEHGATRFAGWTGSLTDHSITEYYHLLGLALRYESPLPLEKAVADEWARALDASMSPAPPGELLRLCAPGEEVQEGYRRRLSETMGVVISTESSSAAELTILERQAPPIPAAVTEALEALRSSWVRPDGEELVDAMSVLKCAHELACGLFYRWIFPRGEPEALIKEWLAARKDWHRELRQKLLDRREYLDSQNLCEHAAQRAWGDRPNPDKLPEWKAYSWPRWRDVKALVKPETEGVRIDDFLARDAAEWALNNRGVVWYKIVEFGEWIAEISGLPMHGGGPDAPARLLGGKGKRKGTIYKGEDGSRSIVVSLKSHGRGRDGLQWLFDNQLFANSPANATDWEQGLGRIDRQGQLSSKVTAYFFRHTEETKSVIDQALRRAAYVEGTLGQRQKLIMGFKV